MNNAMNHCEKYTHKSMRVLLLFVMPWVSMAAYAQSTPNIAGQYAQNSADNFDDYLKDVGVGFAARMAIKNTSNTITLSNNADTWTLQNAQGSFKTTSVTFTLGTPVSENTVDGRTVNAPFTLDGAVLTEVQQDPNSNKTSTITRDFSNLPTMTETLSSGQVKATRVYTQQQQ
jgi:fatty acid-binding protein 4, adipocyte